jgi:hypothetical protein
LRKAVAPSADILDSLPRKAQHCLVAETQVVNDCAHVGTPTIMPQ